VTGKDQASAFKGKKTLIIGAAGAIGKELTRSLLVKNGPGSVIAALRKTPLS
jgi:FlaA1/EpsC-like NDP-sugar epimerase